METIIAKPVRQPKWVVEYDAKEITAQIAPYVLQVTYTDNLSGESDDIEINIEDRDHRWKNAWFPGKGDTLRLCIGYEGEKLLNCGSFQIDEIEVNGPPDTVSIRALAAGVNQALRTENTAAYEDMTLEEVAKVIAKKNGYKLVGTVRAQKKSRKVKRITQMKEKDLTFLKRLGEAEGVIFSVKDGQLVWHDLDELDAAKSIVIIDRKQMTHFTFRAKSNQVYKACEVSYFDAKTKKLITHQFKADGVGTGDVLKLNVRCESKEEAIIKAAAALRNQNGRQLEGNISIEGNNRLVAGGNIEITGMGVFDGGYQILKARHSMERGQGYKTEIEFSSTGDKNKNIKNLRNNKRVVK